MDEIERQEWDRQEDAAERARRAFEDHKLTGYTVGRGVDSLPFPAASALGNPEWWATYDALKAAAQSAREAADTYWERHRPRR